MDNQWFKPSEPIVCYECGGPMPYTSVDISKEECICDNCVEARDTEPPLRCGLPGPDGSMCIRQLEHSGKHDNLSYKWNDGFRED